MLGCWASKCPEKTCHVRKEHRHEGANYRSNAPLSWVTTKKNWPWKKNAKKDKAKKEKGGKKQKFKYLLPGEVVNDPKPNDKVEKSK
ncbi:MAG: hypothetical protein KA313_02180 [Pseudarcicella sp.]|nr:hypothetical protein [Pseudarcicella sp.]MBP6409887.1 hypothetical protein [Pseudarcicella sp.]